MKRTETFFNGRGGLRIFRQRWLPERPRATVVIAHGLGEHSGRYAHVAEALVAADLAVYALDHRGHGRSEGKRACIDDHVYAVEDIDTLVNSARREQKARASGNPVFLLGHSMGGALSLAYALRHPRKLDGLMLSGPAVSLDGLPKPMVPISKLLARHLPGIGLFKVDPALVSRDPDMVAAYADDPLNAHGKIPVKTLGEIIRLVEGLPARLPSLTLPLLIQHGSDDKLAGVSGSQQVIDTVASTDKTLKVYDGLYHEIFNELPDARAEVIGDLISWLSARLTEVRSAA